VFGIGLMIVGGLNVLMAQRWSSAGSAGSRTSPMEQEAAGALGQPRR